VSVSKVFIFPYENFIFRDLTELSVDLTKLSACCRDDGHCWRLRTFFKSRSSRVLLTSLVPTTHRIPGEPNSC